MKKLTTTSAVVCCAGLLLFVFLARGAVAQQNDDGGAAPAPEGNPYSDGGADQAAPGESQGEDGQAEEGGEAGRGEPEPQAEYDDLFSGPDMDPLREELTAIMDELVQTRSRMAVLGRQLFETRIRVAVHDHADEQTLSRIRVELDGAPIFRAESELDDASRQVFDGFAAPGPHLLTVEVEQRSRDDDDYSYTLRNTFRLEVLRGKLTEVVIVLDDDSDMAEDFPEDHEGEYEPRMHVRVAARELDAP